MKKAKKKIGINEVIKHNKIIKNSLKPYIYKMKSCCLKCRKDTGNINPKFLSTSNGKAMILSKCRICGSKKSRFSKNQKSRSKETIK